MAGRRCTRSARPYTPGSPKVEDHPNRSAPPPPAMNAPAGQGQKPPSSKTAMVCPARRASDEQDENKRLSGQAVLGQQPAKNWPAAGGSAQRQNPPNTAARAVTPRVQSALAARRLGRRPEASVAATTAARTRIVAAHSQSAHAGIPWAGRSCGISDAGAECAPSWLAGRGGGVSTRSARRRCPGRERGPRCARQPDPGRTAGASRSFSGSSGVVVTTYRAVSPFGQPHASGDRLAGRELDQREQPAGLPSKSRTGRSRRCGGRRASTAGPRLEGWTSAG